MNMRKIELVIALLMFVCIVPMHVKAQKQSDLPPDVQWSTGDQLNKKALNYMSIREADVFWHKRIWRTIDVREKLNLPFAYPQKTFIAVLVEGIKSGELRAYRSDNDSFTMRLTSANLDQALGTGMDTVQSVDSSGNSISKIVPRTFDPKSVIRFRIKEDWVFDKQTSTMIVRIEGICPVKQDVDAQGNIRGEKPMFWIYYPECRNFLATKLAFNEKNDTKQLTWEDLLEQRKFSSYVIKEDNVYDRRIQDYATGVDALLESDRIKNTIFEWEHDVWSF